MPLELFEAKSLSGPGVNLVVFQLYTKAFHSVTLYLHKVSRPGEMPRCLNGEVHSVFRKSKWIQAAECMTLLVGDGDTRACETVRFSLEQKCGNKYGGSN